MAHTAHRPGDSGRPGPHTPTSAWLDGLIAGLLLSGGAWGLAQIVLLMIR